MSAAPLPTLPWGEELPEILLHVTAAQALSNISLLGLVSGAQWANADVAAYHARLLEDAGHAPVVLSLPRELLLTFRARPDWEALDTPPLEVVMRDTTALSLLWTNGDPTAERSLGIVGSLRTGQSIPASVLHAHLPHLREQASRARAMRRGAAKAQRKKTKR